MAETQVASLGYMGEFHLYDGTALYELREVKSFDIPTGGTREQVEVTHLKSPDWRRQYIGGFYEDSEIEVVLNSRVLSTTDTLLEEAAAEGDERAFKAVIPENGVPVAQVEGVCRCTGYSRGTIEPDAVQEATATFSIVSVGEIVAYVAP